MGVVLTFPGGDEFQNSLAALSMRVSRGAEFATREGAILIKDAIQENMHGPLPPKPGGSDPAYRTGNLFDSVNIRAIGGSLDMGRWNYIIEMDQEQAPYAARIELGFRGTDSLGRNYDQPPYPYFYKGVELAVSVGAIDAIYEAAYEEAIQ